MMRFAEKMIPTPFRARALSTGLFFGLSLASWAGAGSSLMQTADVLAPGQYEAKAQADIVTNNGGGFNLSPHIRTGLVEHFLDIDAFFGTGTTDFQLGALGKYNFLPDLDDQVGLAFNFGFSFVRDNSINSFLTTFGAIVSKKFPSSFGAFHPYASFQFEGLINSAQSRVPLTLILGNRWELNQIPWAFYSEIGMNLHESLWTLALGASYPF